MDQAPSSGPLPHTHAQTLCHTRTRTRTHTHTHTCALTPHTHTETLFTHTHTTTTTPTTTTSLRSSPLCWSTCVRACARGTGPQLGSSPAPLQHSHTHTAHTLTHTAVTHTCMCVRAEGCLWGWYSWGRVSRGSVEWGPCGVWCLGSMFGGSAWVGGSLREREALSISSTAGNGSQGVTALGSPVRPPPSQSDANRENSS